MKERILITVKTYPTLSKKYAELVCTAGVNESGEWRRIYPIRFRQLADDQRYKKYQWVEAEISKSTSDNRPETYQIENVGTLDTIGDPLNTADNWSLRRTNFIDKVKIYNDMSELIELSHENELSLAMFRPVEWVGFVNEEVEREWDAEKLAALENQRKQEDIFKDAEEVAKDFAVVDKLPYKFSYKFKGSDSKERTLMIEDWEIGALYRNCLKRSESEEEAVGKVRQKYWDEFVDNPEIDLLLVLGTTLEHHNKKAPNPFVIVSVVPLKNSQTNQESLFSR